jgi:hypothetical protein
MIVYHEADPGALTSILSNGIKRTQHGELGTGDTTVKTNKLLDACRPQALRDAGVSRTDNIYGYLTTNTGIMDAYSGQHMSEREKDAATHRTLLCLEVTATRCYVSDREAYEELKAAVDDNQDSFTIDSLTARYWRRLIRLDGYKMGEIIRPEVMITYDIPPQHINVVSPH